MKNYIIKVDNKYFCGESLTETYSNSCCMGISGFFQMNPNPSGLSVYNFSQDVSKADKISGYNICNYMNGIIERMRNKAIPEASKIEFIET